MDGWRGVFDDPARAGDWAADDATGVTASRPHAVMNLADRLAVQPDQPPRLLVLSVRVQLRQRRFEVYIADEDRRDSAYPPSAELTQSLKRMSFLTPLRTT